MSVRLPALEEQTSTVAAMTSSSPRTTCLPLRARTGAALAVPLLFGVLAGCEDVPASSGPGTVSITKAPAVAPERLQELQRLATASLPAADVEALAGSDVDLWLPEAVAITAGLTTPSTDEHPETAQTGSFYLEVSARHKVTSEHLVRHNPTLEVTELTDPPGTVMSGALGERRYQVMAQPNPESAAATVVMVSWYEITQ